MRIKEIVETREFYELMQSYRHSPLSEQEQVCACFEKVKEFLIKSLEDEWEFEYTDENGRPY